MIATVIIVDFSKVTQKHLVHMEVNAPCRASALSRKRGPWNPSHQSGHSTPDQVSSSPSDTFPLVK